MRINDVYNTLIGIKMASDLYHDDPIIMIRRQGSDILNPVLRVDPINIDGTNCFDIKEGNSDDKTIKLSDMLLALRDCCEKSSDVTVNIWASVMYIEMNRIDDMYNIITIVRKEIET